MSRLNYNARNFLTGAHVTQAAWARWNGWPDGTWGGDACGCPDDRCAGYHHDEDAADCECLRSLMTTFELELDAAAGVSDADLYAGRFGSRYPTP